MLKSNGKKVSRAGIDAFVTKMIRKSSKAPASFARERDRMRKTGTDIAVDVKKRGFKLPWGLIFIAGAFVVAVIFFLKFRGKEGFGEGGITPGELKEPIDLKGADAETLLDQFGFKKEKGKGEPGRPFGEGG